MLARRSRRTELKSGLHDSSKRPAGCEGMTRRYFTLAPLRLYPSRVHPEYSLPSSPVHPQPFAARPPHSSRPSSPRASPYGISRRGHRAPTPPPPPPTEPTIGGGNEKRERTRSSSAPLGTRLLLIPSRGESIARPTASREGGHETYRLRKGNKASTRMAIARNKIRYGPISIDLLSRNPIRGSDPSGETSLNISHKWWPLILKK
jgi:hypothetical protein